jgi:type I restriction enzyme R subunit
VQLGLTATPKRKDNVDTYRYFGEPVFIYSLTVGVEELDQNKLTPLLRLKYHDSIADAVADLGKPDEIGKVFAGFQRYLYAGGA